MGGGNLLPGFFDQTDTTGFSVIFHVPLLPLADGRPAMIFDFGDGSATWAADATGQVKHVYSVPGGAHPWIVAPVLTDPDNVVRDPQRLEIPRGQYRPWDVSAPAKPRRRAKAPRARSQRRAIAPAPSPQ